MRLYNYINRVKKIKPKQKKTNVKYYESKYNKVEFPKTTESLEFNLMACENRIHFMNIIKKNNIEPIRLERNDSSINKDLIQIIEESVNDDGIYAKNKEVIF